MSEINELHDQAMEFADLAFLAKRRGDTQKSDDYTLEAYRLEAEAAALVASDISAEPTRSILHRSAAVLALESGNMREAERLIAIALSGNPPFEIADELRDLLDKVHFERHLQLRDISLNPNEVQFSIAGNEAGHGVAQTDEFLDRVKDVEKLIFRTVERLLGQEYRERGSAKTSVTQGYQLYISAPRPGSFSVTLRLGRQMALPGFDISTQAINEVLECIKLINNGQEEELKEKIPQPAYYQNFVGLAKRIAPDGDAINFVGLTTVQDGIEKGAPLTRPKRDFPLIASTSTGTGESRTSTITGQLKHASSIRANQIRVVDTKGKVHIITVPEGLMSDVVRPYWDTNVKITVSKQDNRLTLIDIEAETS